MLESIIEAGRGLPAPGDGFGGPFVSGALPAMPCAVMVFQREDLGFVSEHLHHRFVWMLLTAGQASVVLEGRTLDVQPGQSVLIFPFQAHHRAHFGQVASWVIVTFELDAWGALEPMRHRVLGADERAEAMTLELVRSFVSAVRSRRTRGGDCGVWLAGVLEALLRRAASQPVPPTQPIDNPSRHRLGEAVRYIAQHLDQPLGLDAIAAHLGMSESHLRRVFRDNLGMSLGRFVTRTRMNRAYQLIAHEGYAVHTAATAIGFDSPYAFSRAFKRVHGIPPSTLKRGGKTES